MKSIPNYFERAVALLASQFQIANVNGSVTNFQGMIKAILTQAQLVNTQEVLLNTMRYLDTAQGVQLDGLGQILGLGRASGQLDDSAVIDGRYVIGYRESLQFQIFVNQSTGTPEEMIKILAFLTQAREIWYSEVYPAAYLLTTSGLSFPANPSDLVAALENVSPAGVNMIGITATYGKNPFVFSSDPFDEQFFVNPSLISQDPHPLQVEISATPHPFYIQRGEVSNPDFGGCFSEAILNGDGSYSFDNTGAGQMVEILQT